MPKAKKKSKINTFDYSKDRKKLKKQFKKREAPRIECPQIRNAWSDKKSVARNLRDMGLAFDPNRALPIKTLTFAAVERTEEAPTLKFVRKPYVLNELIAEANLPEIDTKTLSTDLIEYVQYMIREHSENYKAMARDENYYQDTPSQIRRKVDQYKRCHPEEYNTFVEFLKGGKPVST
ncbi:nucleolar protein 16 [Oncorhynchus tshawytscha]|uniref:nucleolar protein 16 n=1 Tax=Oncorhynchus tshawytscha TaxID=74940 RepID=UPI000D09EB3B|nr:nucleolar protein 16 [Oncorhynchus tshawytscha]